MMDSSVQSGNDHTDNSQAFREKQWVRNVREDGDREAFEKLFRAYYKRLYGFAYGYVKTSQDADDIIQEVFLNIWGQRQTWDPGGTVKQYLFAAVRNRALNKIRHDKIRDDAEDDVILFMEELKQPSYPEEDSDLEDLREAIQVGIDQLAPRCKQIFVLSRRSGLTYAEIADVLDISINTVGTQMGRALEFLRSHLADFLPLLLVTLINGLHF